MKLVYVLLVVALLVGGCAGLTVPAKTTIGNKETAVDGNDKETTVPDASAQIKQCKESIDYKVLVAALPKDVNGFAAGEPDGNTLTFQDPTSQNTIKYSTASVTLAKEDNSIDVSILDTCYLQFLSASWLGYYEMDGTDGFLKKTTIDSNPGWHQYDKSSDAYSYTVLVKERVIINAQGSNGVSDSDVEAAAKAIDYAKIAAAVN